jgi:hypothetical protein
MEGKIAAALQARLYLHEADSVGHGDLMSSFAGPSPVVHNPMRFANYEIKEGPPKDLRWGALRWI